MIPGSCFFIVDIFFFNGGPGVVMRHRFPRLIGQGFLLFIILPFLVVSLDVNFLSLFRQMLLNMLG
jgi:hypothetical protein